MKRTTGHITTLERPLRRIIKPEVGRAYVINIDPEGIIRVRPKHGRAHTERTFKVAELHCGQRTLL